MTRGMLSITSRDPCRGVPSQASSYAKSNASLSIPEKIPSFRCTTSTSRPPRLSDSSLIWSIILMAIDSSCMLLPLHRAHFEVALQVRSHRNHQTNDDQTDCTKNYFPVRNVTSPLSLTALNLPASLQPALPPYCTLLPLPPVPAMIVPFGLRAHPQSHAVRSPPPVPWLRWFPARWPGSVPGLDPCHED